MVKSVSIDGRDIEGLCHQKATNFSEATLFDVERMVTNAMQHNQPQNMSANKNTDNNNTVSSAPVSVSYGKALDANTTSTGTNTTASKPRAKSKSKKNNSGETDKSKNKKAASAPSHQTDIPSTSTLVATSIALVPDTTTITDISNQLMLPPATTIVTIPIASIPPALNVRPAPKAKSASTTKRATKPRPRPPKTSKKKEENLMTSAPTVMTIMPSIPSVVTVIPPTFNTVTLPPVDSLVTPKAQISPVKRKRGSSNPLALTLAALSDDATNGLPLMFRPASPLGTYIPSPAASNISLTDGNNSLDTLDLFAPDEFGGWSVDGTVTMHSSSSVDQFGLPSYGLNTSNSSIDNGSGYSKSSKDFYLGPYMLENTFNDDDDEHQSASMMSIMAVPTSQTLLASDINNPFPNLSGDGDMPKDLPEDIFDSDGDDDLMSTSTSKHLDPFPLEVILQQQSLKRSTPTTDSEREPSGQDPMSFAVKEDLNHTSPTKKKRDSKKEADEVEDTNNPEPNQPSSSVAFNDYSSNSTPMTTFTSNEKNMINFNVAAAAAAAHAFGDESLGRSTAIPITTEISGSVVTMKFPGLADDAILPIGSRNLNLCPGICSSNPADVFGSAVAGPSELMLNTGVSTMVPINNNGKKVRLAPVSALAAIANNGASTAAAAGMDKNNCAVNKAMNIVTSNNNNININNISLTFPTPNPSAPPSITTTTKTTKAKSRPRPKKPRLNKKKLEECGVHSLDNDVVRPAGFGNVTYSNPKICIDLEPPGSPNTRRAYFNDKRALIWKSMIQEIQNKKGDFLQRRTKQIGMQRFLAFECQKAFEAKHCCSIAKQEESKTNVTTKPVEVKIEVSPMDDKCSLLSEPAKTIVVDKIEPSLDLMITTLDEANRQAKQMNLAINPMPNEIMETTTATPEVVIKLEIVDECVPTTEAPWQPISKVASDENIDRSQPSISMPSTSSSTCTPNDRT